MLPYGDPGKALPKAQIIHEVGKDFINPGSHQPRVSEEVGGAAEHQTCPTQVSNPVLLCLRNRGPYLGAPIFRII